MAEDEKKTEEETKVEDTEGQRISRRSTEDTEDDTEGHGAAGMALSYALTLPLDHLGTVLPLGVGGLVAGVVAGGNLARNKELKAEDDTEGQIRHGRGIDEPDDTEGQARRQ